MGQPAPHLWDDPHADAPPGGHVAGDGVAGPVYEAIVDDVVDERRGGAAVSASHVVVTRTTLARAREHVGVANTSTSLASRVVSTPHTPWARSSAMDVLHTPNATT